MARPKKKPAQTPPEAPEAPVVDDQATGVLEPSEPEAAPEVPVEAPPRKIPCRVRVILMPTDRQGVVFPPAAYQDLGKLFRKSAKTVPDIAYFDEDLAFLDAGEMPPKSPCVHANMDIPEGHYRHLVCDQIRDSLDNHPLVNTIQIIMA